MNDKVYLYLHIEFNSIGRFLKEQDILKVGPIITATFSVTTDNKYDMQIMVPIDKIEIKSNKYQFKKKFRITKAVCKKHLENPIELQQTFDALANYISEHQLQQITAAYNITSNQLNQNGFPEIEVYIGIADNLL